MNESKMGIWAALAAIVVATGCAAGELEGLERLERQVTQAPPTLRILLHDAPADEVDEVWVEIASVRAHGDAGWVEIASEPIAVDLLTLQNGVAAELGLAELAPGDYDQLRLEVTSSWVVVDGETGPLKVPSGGSSGLKIPHHFTVPECGGVTLSLDWDVGAHLTYARGRGHILRPVLVVDGETADESGCDGPIDAHADSAARYRIATADEDLAALSDGTVIAYGDGDGTLFDAATGAILDDLFPSPGHRAGVWATPDDTTIPDLIAGRSDARVGVWSSGAQAWRSNGPSCCNAQRIPPAIDRVLGQVYYADMYRVYQNDGRTGASRGTVMGGNRGGFVSLAPGLLWKAGDGGLLTSFSRSSWLWGYQRFSLQLGGGLPLRPAAVASDGSAVVSVGGDPYFSANQPGALMWVTSSRTIPWRIDDAGTVSAPVLGAGDVVFVGAALSGGGHEVRSYGPDGALLWATPVTGAPRDLVVGDDGSVYVAADTEVLGLDQATGEQTLRYYGLSGVDALLLEGGVALASGGGEIVALPVPATGVDPAASWPARFANNQRTGGR